MSGSNPTRDAPEELRKVYNPANKNTIHKPRNLQQEAPHTAAESKANWGANRKFQSSVEMKSSAPNSGVSSTLAARGSGSTCHEHLDQERPFRSLSDNLTGSTGRPGSMNTNREGPGSNPMTPEASMGHAGMQRAVEVADHYTIALANIPYKSRWQDLKDLVRNITPNIERAEIYLSPDGRSRGYGRVIVRGRNEAEKVKEKLDGYPWEGRGLIAMLLEKYCPVFIPPHRLNYSSSPAYSNVPSLNPGSLTGYQIPYLPVEYHDLEAMNRAIPADTTSLQVAKYHQCIYWQAFLHYNGCAIAHSSCREQMRYPIEEARISGCQEQLTELQKTLDSHLESERNAASQAYIAHQKAQAELEKLNQLLRAEGLPPIPIISPSFQQPFLIPVPVLGSTLGSGGFNIDLIMPVSPFAETAAGGFLNQMGEINQGASTTPADYSHVQRPIYVTSPNGLPVNLSYGVVQTECRGIFIQNLPWETTWRELKDFLRSHGCSNILRVDVPYGANGKGKGNGTVLFGTSQEAEQACEMLRNRNLQFKKRTLYVRMDKYCSTKRTLGPQNTGVGDDTRGGGDNQIPNTIEGSNRSASTSESCYTPPVVVVGSSQ